MPSHGRKRKTPEDEIRDATETATSIILVDGVVTRHLVGLNSQVIGDLLKFDARLKDKGRWRFHRQMKTDKVSVSILFNRDVVVTPPTPKPTKKKKRYSDGGGLGESTGADRIIGIDPERANIIICIEEDAASGKIGITTRLEIWQLDT